MSTIPMPIEIEAKYKVEELESYAELAERAGGQLSSEFVQRDQFFDRAERALLKSDSGLRLRTESESGGCRALMCFKGPRQQGQYKRREEIEFEVASAESAEKLLHAIGFGKNLIVEKKRQLWLVDNCQVCLDEVVKLGYFVEIEGPSEAEIESVAEKLKLADHEHIRISYAKMLAQIHEPPLF